MSRASLVALALLGTTWLGSCGMRYSGSYSSGKSFTTSVPGNPGTSGTVGSLSADVYYSDYTANSYSAILTLESGRASENYDLEARIFQDLNGDDEYSPSADRLLATSVSASRVPGSNQLQLDPIEFKFKPRHQPLGIIWVIQGPAGDQFTITEMFD